MNLEDFIHIFESSKDFFQTPVGIVSFISIYLLWVVFLLPGSWLTMLSGFLYGSLLGTCYVFIGASLGAISTFIIGRNFFRKWTENRINRFRRLVVLKKAISEEGLKIIILSRLSPAFPFGLLNLAYGLSEVKIRDFIIGLIAIIPGTYLYCSVGNIAGDINLFQQALDSRNSSSTLFSSLLSVVATFFVVFFAARASRKALKDLE
tara:strand:- start:382 stop:999 length:618 start_codon:yes stop_codon:yes gene_type:complete